ncbi:MAG TPA: NlpC/P60 family protein [Streptosporangiaceae bacterium]|nr:NlpC/P60 family protein [Streptosporangiaceae bacterium]
MGTRPAGSESVFRRGVAIATGLVAIGGLAVFASVAGASPQPTVAQVQAQVNQLTSQYDKVTEQLDQVGEQLSAAQTRLAQVRTADNHANAEFRAAQTTVAQIAAATFEDTGATSIAGVLTSGDPSVVLRQGSLLMALSGNRNAETTQLLTDASQLAGVEQEQQRTESGIAALKTQLADHKNSLGKLIATEQTTLDSLTVPQQQTVKSNTIGANGSTQKVTYTGPTGSQADQAVAFAYAQLGCPYVYGGTGPCQMGFDCSGLAQAAWGAAGVSIPRDSYEQWAELPHVSLSSIEPGDLLIYNGEGHVAIYVGNGYIIDAPQTGMDVEKIPMSTPWYADNLDGVVRP